MRTLIAFLIAATASPLSAAEPPLKDMCTRVGISGRIVDAVSGQPVKGAKVWFQYQFMTSGLALRNPGEAVTDADGRFRVPSEYRKSKFLYGVTDDPTDANAWKPDVPIKIRVDHPDYHTFHYDFPTKRQNKKLPYLRQYYPIFTDGADYKIQPKGQVKAKEKDDKAKAQPESKPAAR